MRYIPLGIVAKTYALFHRPHRALLYIRLKYGAYKVEKLNRHYSGKLGELRGLHEGQRCFVIGNGPSLNDMDLSILENEITIGCNRIYLNNRIVPTYYCIEDARLLKTVYKALEKWSTEDTIKFIPTVLADHAKNISNVCLVNFMYERYEGGEPKFSEDISRICYWGSMVTYMMLELAYHLGCNPIYLIGMDGVRPGVYKHFYEKDDVQENPPRYELSDAALKKARKFMESKGIEIYNATKNPVRSFFKQVEYEEIFK